MWSGMAARGALVALALATFTATAAATEQETFYLGPDGFPLGELAAQPSGGKMPNYDLGRDVEPGLLLERSSLGLEESEKTRFQHWQTDMSGQRLTGYPSMVIWSAPARFDPGKRGVFSVYLLDCSPFGSLCTELGHKEVTVEKGWGSAWVESTIHFDPIDHLFEAERHLGVRIVVSDSSESDMMIAYGYPAYRSRLTIEDEAPVTSEEVVASVPPDTGELKIDKAYRQATMTPAAPEVVDEGTSLWPWLVTLAISSAILLGLGAVLVSKLTKTGRHERPAWPDTDTDPSQTPRISVSAR